MVARGECHVAPGAGDRKRGVGLGDGELPQRAGAGDAEAFWQLAERHQRPVYRIVAALIGPGPEAEDAAQETLVRAFHSLSRYDPERPFGPWLRGIAVNVSLQHRRRLARRRRGPHRRPCNRKACLGAR